MSPFKLVAAGVTDVGRVRDGNEDDFLDQSNRLGLVAVADGMGGHRAGEVASATALEALRAAVASGQPLRTSMASAMATGTYLPSRPSRGEGAGA